jgi:hypothetical protein
MVPWLEHTIKIKKNLGFSPWFKCKCFVSTQGDRKVGRYFYLLWTKGFGNSFFFVFGVSLDLVGLSINNLN